MSSEQITAEQAIQNLATVARAHLTTAEQHEVLRISIAKVHSDRLQLAKLEAEHAKMREQIAATSKEASELDDLRTIVDSHGLSRADV